MFVSICEVEDSGSGAKECCNLNATRDLRLTLKQCHAINEHEIKHSYNRRTLEANQGSFKPFKPLLFTVNGSMADECKAFYSRLVSLL